MVLGTMAEIPSRTTVRAVIAAFGPDLVGPRNENSLVNDSFQTSNFTGK
jgi:hypothetical protein